MFGAARQRIIRNRVGTKFLAWGLGYDTQILLHPDHVAVFPGLGIVYNRIKKSGNTTVSAFLFEAANEFNFSAEAGFKKKFLTPLQMTWKEIWALQHMRSIVVVRDPFSRVLSGFLQKVARGSRGTHRDQKYAEFPGFGDATPEGFLAFLLGLENGLIHRNRHFWPQSSLLFQRLDRFDHVIKLETLVGDMTNLLNAIGMDPNLAMRLSEPHRVDVEGGGTKITRATNKMSAYYDVQSRELVRRLYLRDFEAFGYSKV